ncbi:hypothetical protein P5V15_004401 [Pogonomyrmex californicus]
MVNTSMQRTPCSNRLHRTGVTYPCIHAIWANWAPPLERSKLATIGFSGSFFGTVFAMPIAGLIAEYWGWPFIFYIFGTAGLVWFICWWFIVKDRPEDDRFISKAELEYIKSSLDNDEKKKQRFTISLYGCGYFTVEWTRLFTAGAVGNRNIANVIEYRNVASAVELKRRKRGSRVDSRRKGRRRPFTAANAPACSATGHNGQKHLAWRLPFVMLNVG